MSKRKPRILISNDDGVHAPGIRTLAREMRALGEVIVVAPDSNQSAVSHALTMNRPLRIRKIDTNVYSVDGTPTDCITLAFHEILKSRWPDVIVSGLNHGANMGEDVTYSGTVAAALEGSIMGLPAVAASMTAADPEGKSFVSAAKFIRRLVANIIGRMPPSTLLNVNFPRMPRGGYRAYEVTRLGRRTYSDIISARRDLSGRSYYWIGGEPTWDRRAGTDADAIKAGKVSITPLNFDMTDLELLRAMAGWRLH
ncbi:MAG TPA: 5'/3'-nucleotidase SurE [bacterium]|nr:5'/3'-nucleotidase SurE [bacterium]